MAQQDAFVDQRNLNINIGGRNLIIVVTIFVFLDILFIGTRFYARRIQRKFLEINDYAILVAFVVGIIGFGLQIIQVVYAGLGVDPAWVVLNLGAERLRFLLKCIFASNIMFNVTTMAIKISILHFYLTLFDSNVWMRRLVWVTMILTVIFHSAFIIEICLICKPLAYYWDLGFTIKSGSCWSPREQRLGRLIPGVLSLFLDIVVFVLPLPILWTIRMPTSKKLATSAVFGVAFGVCLVAGIRLIFLYQRNAEIKFAIAGCIEPTVGIMVACTPMVRPVIQHLSGGKIVLWGTNRNKASHSSGGVSKFSISWPVSTQKSYISSVKGAGTKGFERIEEDDVPLKGIGKFAERSGRQDSEEDRNWMSVAEQGRIRITRDVIIDNRPRSTQ